MIQQKKEKNKYEYNISSEDGSEDNYSSDSGSSDFVISRKKAHKDRKEPKKKAHADSDLRNEFNELRNIVTELAMLQKKTKRRASSEGRSKGSGTKVIVVPQQVSSQNKPTDAYMEKLRKSIFD